MRKILTVTALALISFIACEKSSHFRESRQAESSTQVFPKLQSPYYETLKVRRDQISDNLRVARQLVFPHRTDTITIIRPSSVWETEPVYYEQRRGNPPK